MFWADNRDWLASRVICVLYLFQTEQCICPKYFCNNSHLLLYTFRITAEYYGVLTYRSRFQCDSSFLMMSIFKHLKKENKNRFSTKAKKESKTWFFNKYSVCTGEASCNSCSIVLNMSLYFSWRSSERHLNFSLYIRLKTPICRLD